MTPPPINIDGTDITGATIDGADVSEVTVDGTQVFGNVIPDSVVTQYTYEDDSDTSVATDAVGSNDGNISGGSFNSTNPRCGSFALDVDGDFVKSQNTINLASQGTSEALSVATFVNPDSVSDFDNAVGWGQGISNFVVVQAENGEWQARMQVSGTNVEAKSGATIDTSSYQHVVAAVDSDNIWIIVDGVEEARTSHSLTPSNIGSQPLSGATGPFGSPISGLYDNTTFATDGLTESDADALINQC